MKYSRARDGNMYCTQDPIPEGWYLRGVVVLPQFRRLGVARFLTEARLRWLNSRTSEVFCFLDSEEKATLSMYESLGFVPKSVDWRFTLPDMNNETGLLLHRSMTF
jgi:ribosomal protein S18 acetylase RimI-like enzyme